MTFFALAMSACVLGMVLWKAIEAKATTLERGQIATQNLAHSLAEHAAHTILAADITLTGLAEFLKYQTPEPERLNRYLANAVEALPQIREIVVLNAEGDWQYSSLPQLPHYNNSDRRYFLYHRDTVGPALRINAPIESRLTGRPTVILSKRISRQDGSFGGVLVARDRQRLFQFVLQPVAARRRWCDLPAAERRCCPDPLALDQYRRRYIENRAVLDPAQAEFRGLLQDGLAVRRRRQIFGYEEASQYPVVVTVARSESEMLASWRAALRTDALVAGVLLCMIVLLAALLASQFRFLASGPNARCASARRVTGCWPTTSPTS